MDLQALFSDQSPEYMRREGDRIFLRLRALKGEVQTCSLMAGGRKRAMKKILSDQVFDYFEGSAPADRGPFHYYFRITFREGESLRLGRRGVVSRIRPGKKDSFYLVPDFSVPDWPAGAVGYQIFTDRFCKGDPSTDVQDREYFYNGDYTKRIKDWYQNPAPNDVQEFYGGDLQGVMDKLDYLEDLGVDVLYFNPLFVSPSNHKYDTQDYDYIDPHFGKIVREGGEVLEEGDKDNAHASRYKQRVTDRENLEASNAFFAELTAEAHRRGMKIILDGVFNHCGSFHKWLDREGIYAGLEGCPPGAFTDPGSPYVDFFGFTEKAWPGNWHYEGWWGYDTLPKLNYEGSEDLCRYILEVGKKWVSPPYNCDGWRLDVAADLGHSAVFNHDFWKRFRAAVKKANPQAVILAENYFGSQDWLQGDEWDTIMNYEAFMEPLTWFLTGMEKHSDEYRRDLHQNADAFWEAALWGGSTAMPSQPARISMNQLSNHDHSRFLTRTSGRPGRLGPKKPEQAAKGIRKGVFMEAVVVLMTWPGMPTLYYGDEAGLCGFTDPDNRRTYPWGREDRMLLSFHKDIIRLHKAYPCIRSGSLKPLASGEGLIAYARFDSACALAAAVNNTREEKEIVLPLMYGGFPMEGEARRVFMTRGGRRPSYKAADLSSPAGKGETVPIRGGKAALTLPPESSAILVWEKKEE